MRLTVPEPKIDLYNDGFADHDQLDRKATGDKLSDLVERIDDPMVIALDGAWGSGKSFFLKCWVGEHLKRKGNTTQTVYFDAFEHDFLDDPLIALTGAIAERFAGKHSDGEQRKTSRISTSKALTKLKKFGLFLGKATGKAVVSAGAHYVRNKIGEDTYEVLGEEWKEVLGDGIDTAENDAKALFDADWGEATSEDFWKEQRAKSAAMEAFRLALTELTQPATKEQAEDDPKLQEGIPTRKLVVVIDELDRCRPDYALSLLEIIKHFFNVPGVHFVLGVNLKELQNSVKARYGSGVDAAKYLQKFVSVTAPILGPKPRKTTNSVKLNYFDFISKKMEFGESWRYERLRIWLEQVHHHAALSLRDIERIVTLAQVTPSQSIKSEAECLLFSSLLILQVAHPEAMDKARNGTLQFSDITRIFDIANRLGNHSDSTECHCIWKLVTEYPSSSSPSYLDEASETLLADRPGKELVSDIVARCFDTFVLPEHA